MANPCGSWSQATSTPPPTTSIKGGWTPVDGSPGWALRGLTLGQATQGDDPPGFRPVVELPQVLARYHRGTGLVYVLASEIGPWHATAADLETGRTWGHIGVSVRRNLRDAAYLAIQQVGRAHPVSSVSPRITEGPAPLAPVLAPLSDDPEAGRRKWGRLAARLAPAGKLTVGAALLAPWLEPAGATTTVWSLWGEAGAGKSVLAQVCAALYGSHRPGDGLYGPLNSAAQGLTAQAQELSYLPLILDEVQSATTDIGAQMVALATGAQRRRATRAGASAANKARWGSLAIVTGNQPLAELLPHEMWDRRLVEVSADALWSPDRPTDREEATQWWAANARAVVTMAGWPWQALTADYPPGPDAGRLTEWINGYPMPGAGNIGMVARLAYVGCVWMAHWTGDQSWLDGVWDAAVAVAADTAGRVRDPARDTAAAIIDHRLTHPGLWNGTSDRDRAAIAATVSEQYDDCEVGHDGDCDWWHLLAPTFHDLATVTLSRLDGLRRAMHCPTRHMGHRIRSIGPRVRVYTVCVAGLGDLAYPDDDPEVRPPGPPLPAPELGDEGDDRPPAYGSSTDPDVGAALDSAVAQGLTDLTGPDDQWEPAAIAAAGWETHGWEGIGASSGIVTRGDQRVRVRRHHDPAGHADALADWAQITGHPVRTSIPRLGADLLRRADEQSQSRTPRWMLPPELDALWAPPGAPYPVAHPAQWGTPGDGDTAWDRVRSHLSAITQARIAPLWHDEEYRRVTGADVPDDLHGVAGMWRIVVPAWPEPRLPSPVGPHDPGTEVWVTTEIMALYHDRKLRPEVAEAIIAPRHRVTALDVWAKQVKEWLDEAQGRPAEQVAKALYQSLAGGMMSLHRRGQRYTVYRPDWGWAITDNSWCSVLRRVYQAADNDDRWPSAVRTDAIYYPGSDCPPSLPVGDRLGHFRPEPVT